MTTSPAPGSARVDLHCHSWASASPALGVQRALGLPECATPPDEVHRLAKRRGMDFVTITDHDTIDGVLEIADRPDVFVSVELTAHFRGEPQAVHVLCWGITPADHDWLQAHRGDVEACAAYLGANRIACGLAHPFYAVATPLQPRHRRRLAELFAIWETRNGARAPDLNLPAATYVDTRGGTGVAGSDDHAGVDIGRTFTETPPAADVAQLLDHLRAGRAVARGDQGSAVKWAHAAIALADRVLGDGPAPPPDPLAVLSLVAQVASDGGDRGGADAGDLTPTAARSLLRGWLDAVELPLTAGGLAAHMQSADFTHAGLFRQARRVHERKLRRAVGGARAGVAGGGDPLAAALGLFEACLPAVPYAPAAAFLGHERARLARREDEPPRVAVVADGLDSTHGVTGALAAVRERGVPGFEVEVVGTDPQVDRRLPAVADFEVPFYPGLTLGVPSLLSLVDMLADGRYRLLHLCAPGPAGLAAALLARVTGVPTVGSHHTDLAAYAALRSGEARNTDAMRAVMAAFYGPCSLVLSPSAPADRSLHALGIAPERIARWERGVDLERFDPGHRELGLLPGAFNLLYAGRLTVEKGADRLADAFLAAHARDPRLHLVLAGGGPEEDRLRARLGDRATFLGWLEGEELARAYASADLFVFCSHTDTYGQVVVEAQASGLPVVAVDQGGPVELIVDGATGRLCRPDADRLAAVVLELAADREQRERLARGALTVAHGRTWTRALGQLAAGYVRALAGDGEPAAESRAA